MILIKIDRKSPTPIYRQIIHKIIQLIEEGVLKNGTRLPSTRQLAQKLGINRSTICHAYLELLALGYVESSPGSYTTIRKRPEVVTKNHKSDKGLISWPQVSNPACNNLYRIFQNYSPEYRVNDSSGIINLSQLDLDSRIFPVEDFRRCLNQVLINEDSKILQYGECAGYALLREHIAQRLQIHAIAASAKEILITNGTQQALELILKLLTVPGKKVVIEAPTYANILVLLQFYQIDMVEIPMRENGMDLQYLKTQLEKFNPAFIYTIPNFHNPTGITTNQAHREALLSICEKFRVPIVEDGFEEEMKYFGKVVLPIKSMDKNQIIIYLGTFSKVLFPGIRLGWIAADEQCTERLTAIKRFCDISSNLVLQAAVAAFCRLGYYDLHIKRMHRIFRKRMQVALNTLKLNMPEGVTWTQPDGGYTIWVTLKTPYPDESLFQEMLLKHGVLVSPGDYYFHRSHPHKYFRLSIANLNEQEIEKGIIRLGEALKALNF